MMDPLWVTTAFFMSPPSEPQILDATIFSKPRSPQQGDMKSDD